GYTPPVVNAPPERLAVARAADRRAEPEPVSLRSSFASWYFGSGVRNNSALSVLDNAAALRARVLLITTPDRVNLAVESARRLERALTAAGNPPEWVQLPPSPWGRSAADHPETWLRIAGFLNENFRGFDVQIGPTREVP